LGKYFGTDGFRGEVNVLLTGEHAYKIGRFLGWYYTRLRMKRGDDTSPRIVIGKDTRRSSYMLEYALAAGLTASGADAYLLHVTTTPSVAYATRVDGFDCGVMISASHNPFYDNGIKLLNGNGEKMDEGVIALVEAYLDGEVTAFGERLTRLPYARREKVGRTVDYVAGRNRYVGYLISLGVYSFKGKTVGLDCANGSAWSIAGAVFEALGARVFLTGAEPNGVNINAQVGSTHIDNLRRLVVEKGLDVGFAYDGDADRCLCVDEKGRIIDGDRILYILGKRLHEKGELVGDRIVTTVMSNLGLYKALDEAGISYAQTAVGDKYVYEEMQKSGAVLGGEQSGHIIVSKYATTGDGVLTSLKLMEVALDKKLPFSALSKEMTTYPQLHQSVKVRVPQKVCETPSVHQRVKDIQARLGDKGRVLLRKSGTEPVVRVMAEAEDEAECLAVVEELTSLIRLVDESMG